jgi:hypothetical protein
MFLHVTSPCNRAYPKKLMQVCSLWGVMLSVPLSLLQVRVLRIGWCVERNLLLVQEHPARPPEILLSHEHPIKLW